MNKIHQEVLVICPEEIIKIYFDYIDRLFDCLMKGERTRG